MFNKSLPLALAAGALSLGIAVAAEKVQFGAGDDHRAPRERRDPAQVFQFLDKDRSGALSAAEFDALKDRMPSFRHRPEAVGEMFKRLDVDRNGSLSLEEYRAIASERSRRPGASPAEVTRSTAPASASPSP
jgi:hypothetical protein